MVSRALVSRKTNVNEAVLGRFSADLDEMAQNSAVGLLVKESYAQLVSAVSAIDNDDYWKPIYGLIGSDKQHFTLEDLQKVIAVTREHTIANPLLKRAAGLRGANVFAKPFAINAKIRPGVQKIVDDPGNEAVIGGPNAWMLNERTAFTDGNVLLMYNTREQEWSRLPLENVTAVMTAPDNPERVRFYQRQYTRQNNANDPNAPAETITEWVAVDSWKSKVRGTSIGEHPINKDLVIVDAYFNSDSGQTFGVPDALPALPWAALYREYLKDGAKVIKALASIAWVLKSKTSSGVAKSVSRVPVGGVAATANMTDNMDLQSMPKGNQVDLSTGRALAAMVATAAEVSVVALLSDPGQSGAYGTAKTLDLPTEQAALARQEYWKTVIRRCYRVMGHTTPFEVEFPAISEDPEYRKVQSITQVWNTGVMHVEEYREAAMAALGLVPAETKAPEGVMLPNNEASWERADIDPKDGPAGSTPQTGTNATGSGQSTGVGPLADGDNSARDNEA